MEEDFLKMPVDIKKLRPEQLIDRHQYYMKVLIKCISSAKKLSLEEEKHQKYLFQALLILKNELLPISGQFNEEVYKKNVG